jgi:ankyrin repeat protein
LDVVKYLIQTCHANTEVTDNDGWTPLHFSSRYGYLDVVKFLIHQCHVNVELSNNASETAYDLARKDDVIEYLGGVFADKQNSKNQFDPSVSNIVHLNQVCFINITSTNHRRYKNHLIFVFFHFPLTPTRTFVYCTSFVT